MTVLALQWTYVEFEEDVAAEHGCSEVSIAVATEFATFRAEVFTTRAQVRALASALREWPLSGEAPQARWGGSDGCGGVDIRLGFEPPGRVAIMLRLQRRSRSTHFGALADLAELYLISEPVLIDRFADQLMEMAEWRQRGAELQAVDRFL